MQVAKDAEAVVGPFGGHGQLPQGCADLCQERGRETVTQKREEENEEIGPLRAGGKTRRE